MLISKSTLPRRAAAPRPQSAPRAARAVGIDGSHAMLNLARLRIERSALRNVQLRQGDIYALPVERDGYDLVVVHQVLHYLDEPARALREAARQAQRLQRLMTLYQEALL